MMNLRKIILGVFVVVLPLQHTTVQPIKLSGLAPLGKKVLLGMVVATGGWVAKTYCEKPKERRRDWPSNKKIIEQLDPKEFGEDFRWGVVTSDLQCSGTSGPNGPVKNNITRWIEATQGNPNEKKRWKSMEEASGFWDNFKAQLPWVKKKISPGMKDFRTSIAMSKICTYDKKAEKFIPNEEGIAHYVQVAKEMKDQGLEPVFTFFHHEWSIEFDNMGHFTNKENVDVYVDVYKPVMDALYDAGVRRWMPLNENAGYAMGAFVDGRYPPGKKFDFKGAGEFTKNTTDIHGKFYDYLKAKDKENIVGIPHAFVPIDPYNKYNIVVAGICRLFDYTTNDVVLEYLTTGKFKWPFSPSKLWYGWDENPDIKGKIDFIGVNYYSHAVIGGKRKGPQYLFGDNDKEVYAEGLERVLEKANAYATRGCFNDREGKRIPIIITENAVNAEGEVRETYILRHLLVVQEARKKGIQVKGYHWWGFGSPYFNWGSGFESKHPCIVQEKDNPRKLVSENNGIRKGSEPLGNFINKWFSTYKNKFKK